ncbi:Hypothetical protein CGLY_11735 [Corynebacterium glyciniphilum AJ 3170]|uniref:Tyr recombinase domain-containing protein n=1 Tax=Corynebacterium glyciniphilum AJ 3170 TaxID=1404245 RepID=X5DW30_9CORY|nr:site-specific integrase [Corynebacterium glyciniphilum]AHW64792.1 Hypothetical protein CGLY_11735 [Corynebacterium glyciniphilum AJ 3170]
MAEIKKTASRAPIPVGEHTAYRVGETRTASGTWQVACKAKIPLADDDEKLPKDQGEAVRIVKTGRTKSEAHFNAAKEAERRIADAREAITAAKRQATRPGKVTGRWKPDDPVADFIESVSIPKVEAEDYAPSTVRTYSDVLNLALGICNDRACPGHPNSLNGLNIRDITDVSPEIGARVTLKDCLEEVARLHGSERARQTKNALMNHVYGPLELRGYPNPMDSKTFTRQLKIAGYKRIDRGKTQEALTRDEYETALAWFLALDPKKGVTEPKRGPYRAADRIAKIRNAITLTIFAAGTGARKTELQHVRWADIADTEDGTVVHLAHTKRVAGQMIPRDVLVSDYRVEDYLADLRSERDPAPNDYVIGAPADPSRIWDASNSAKVLRDLYDRAATATGIRKLEEHGLHLWRRTRETMMILAGMDVETRTAQLGHGAAVAAKHYTDYTQLTAMAASARIERPQPRAVK